MELAITGVGAATAVGRSAIETFHSVRCDIGGFSEQTLRDRAGAFVVAGTLASVDDAPSASLLTRQTERALREAWGMARASGLAPSEAVGWLDLRNEPAHPGTKDLSPSTEVVERIISGSVLKVKERVPAGSCAGQMALFRARDLIQTGAVGRCIIGVADSLVQLRVVRWLEDHSRLKCSYVNDGLIPGEGVGWLVVEDASVANRREVPPLAIVKGVSWAKEEASILSGSPNQAKALSNAVAGTLRGAGYSPQTLRSVWSDLNGESYKAREWAFTEIRSGLSEGAELRHPADCYGDPGGAADLLLLVLSAIELASHPSGDRTNLVLAGSDGGFRAATMLSAGSTGAHPYLGALSTSIPAVLGNQQATWGANEPTNYVGSIEFVDFLEEEHCDALAGLYYQRQGVLDGGTNAWYRASESESRILAHSDALVGRCPGFLERAIEKLSSSDESESFAVALVIGMFGDEDAYEAMAEIVPDLQADSVVGVFEGLKHLEDSAVSNRLSRWIEATDPQLQELAIDLVGYHRLPETAPRLVEFALTSGRLSSAACDAIFRLRHRRAVPELEQRLRAPNPPLSCARAAISFGAPRAPDVCRQLVRTGSAEAGVFAEPLAVLGQLTDLPLLTEMAQNGLNRQAGVRALGVMGYGSSIPLLLELLADEEPSVVREADRALFTISHHGNRAGRGGGDDEYETTGGLKEAWLSWWTEQGASFSSNVRWRRGRPFEVVSCLAELRDGNERSARERAHLELLVHTRQDVAFEPDWFTAPQWEAIKTWGGLVEGAKR